MSKRLTQRNEKGEAYVQLYSDPDRVTDIDVYNKLLEQYEVVMIGSEKILIIAKENIQTFNDIAVYLSR